MSTKREPSGIATGLSLFQNQVWQCKRADDRCQSVLCHFIGVFGEAVASPKKVKEHCLIDDDQAVAHERSSEVVIACRLDHGVLFSIPIREGCSTVALETRHALNAATCSIANVPHGTGTCDRLHLIHTVFSVSGLAGRHRPTRRTNLCALGHLADDAFLRLWIDWDSHDRHRDSGLTEGELSPGAGGYGGQPVVRIVDDPNEERG